MMAKPNLFIIGAPKCGTTSLSSWLSGHPQVFMSPIKEPNFFSFDYGRRVITNMSRYEKLFSHASTKHRFVGEASTAYLYSRTAVPAILSYAAAAKIIVMIRNPIEMVRSLHMQRLIEGDETVLNFEDAWNLQSERKVGACVPKHCPDPQLLFYGDICKLGKQLKQLFDLVRYDDVFVMTLDDLRDDPRKEYCRALRFLRLPDDGRREFPVSNRAGIRTHPGFWKGIEGVNRGLRMLGLRQVRLGITERLNWAFRREQNKPAISTELYRSLVDYFEEDIVLLERLLIRDFRHFRAVPKKASDHY